MSTFKVPDFKRALLQDALDDWNSIAREHGLKELTPDDVPTTEAGLEELERLAFALIKAARTAACLPSDDASVWAALKGALDDKPRPH